MELLEFTDKGIYCPRADVYIDPSRPVKRALITHGHADHARSGHQYYLCTDLAKPVIRYRIGTGAIIESVAYHEKRLIDGVSFSFHPAGHIIGSAQIRVEYKGEVWVVSGDYKLEDDGLSTPFEAVKCDVFITESTFGLPIFKWPPQAEIFAAINQWWQNNRDEGKVSILTAYSLGKAQRLIQGLDHSIGPVLTNSAVENTNEIIRTQGIPLKPTQKVVSGMHPKQFAGGLLITPPSTLRSAWIRQFQPYSRAIASGWVAMKGGPMNRSSDIGFVLSDHADWPGLNRAVEETEAQRVHVTHGYAREFTSWLNEKRLRSRQLKLPFGYD
jgi:putative mRNA 3-end processing factor